MTYILGINAYHGDSSACIVKDGDLIAAAEEERFNRIKHWAGFPRLAIEYCLKEAGIKISDINYVAVNQGKYVNLAQKLLYVLGNRPNLGAITSRIRNRGKRSSLLGELSSFEGYQTGSLPKVIFVPHHLAHLASSYLVSPFKESIVVSMDGFGDFASTAWGIAVDGRINLEGQIYFPHSMGIFYQAITQFLGFPNYGDEYKVMGLAPYGNPTYIKKMQEMVALKKGGRFELNLKYFKHHTGEVAYEWDGGIPKVGKLYSQNLAQLLGPERLDGEMLTQRHMDIARSAQQMYEDTLFNLLSSLHEKYSLECLSLAGGCAMNSVANGKIKKFTPFKKIYIQSAAGDAGGAIGAALYTSEKFNKVHGSNQRKEMFHSYWGPSFSDEYIERILQERIGELQAHKCNITRMSDEQEMCDKTATLISEGKVIGWFQGRMEWGPRALGNRSILGDPRRGDMKEILNLKIKRRESFRPFAPSVLKEKVKEWFDCDDNDVPFMMKVYPILTEKKHLIPAVTHVDGSGRLQTVTAESNSRYYLLIKSFEKLTDIPMLLNTSFNENEPIVCRPEEALDCFLRTKMDLLVMGNWMIARGGD